jgi:hypothetical protein
MKTGIFIALAGLILLAAVSVSAQTPDSRINLPAAAQGPVSSELGKNDPSYWFHVAVGRLHAENRSIANY